MGPRSGTPILLTGLRPWAIVRLGTIILTCQVEYLVDQRR